MNVLTEISCLGNIIAKNCEKNEMKSLNCAFEIYKNIDIVFQRNIFNGFSKADLYKILIMSFSTSQNIPSNYSTLRVKYLKTLNLANEDETVKLNITLIIEQDLGQEEINDILKLHNQRIELFKSFEKATNRLSFIPLVSELKSLEFKMQLQWRFDMDENKHTWATQVPQCLCIRPNSVDKGTTICPVHRELTFLEKTTLFLLDKDIISDKNYRVA